MTVTRKLRPGLTPEAARRDVRDFLAWSPKPVTAGSLESAWSIEDRWQFSWWDSLVLALALESGATTLLSEDFQDGLSIESLRIINPFGRHYDPALLETL